MEEDDESLKKERRWPWIGRQQWSHILFCHWPVPYEYLQPVIPKPFKLDTFQNQAWISIVMFQATNSRLRGMPKMLSYPPFLQLNVRTYIRHHEESGVYFFSLDCNRQLAVIGARLIGLPYMYANMSMRLKNNHYILTSERVNTCDSLLCVYASYQPAERLYNDALVHWLTERYCFYMVSGDYMMKGPLSHTPWDLYEASVNIHINGYIGNISRTKLHHPRFFYARSKQSFLHPFEKNGIVSF